MPIYADVLQDAVSDDDDFLDNCRDGKGNTRDGNRFAGRAAPLGDTKPTTQQTTSYHDVTEWRIEYLAK